MKTLSYGMDDKPPLGMTLFLALQYLFLTIGSMVLMPIIVSRACGLDVAQTEYLIFTTLLVSACTTFIQVYRVGKIGSGYLMILGPSGAFIACSIFAVAMGGLPFLGTMTLILAPLEALISYSIRFVRKIFTPALGGTIIMLVAMFIIPLMIEMCSGKPGIPHYCSPAYFFISIPDPVMGGLSIGLMIILFREGFKVAASAELNTENGLVIGIGVSVGFLASFGKFFPGLFSEQFRFVAFDVITIGSLSALILNLFFVFKIRKTETLTVATNIEHIQIDGYQYVQFRI